MTSLLVNFVYCHPVGHAVEALHYAHGYHKANPDLRISVALNAATPVELARLCPFVDEVFPVEVDVFDPDAAVEPGFLDRGFDHVVDDLRGRLPDQRAVFPGLAAYYDAVAARVSTGVAGRGPYPYTRHSRLRFDLPRPARTGGPRIALLPGGSAPRSLYPSLRSWRMIVSALAEAHPDATFVLVGKLRADGRTATTYSPQEMDSLLGALPRAETAVDRPILEQLAAVAGCDVLVSPHSGFGMAALAAGTPWLTLSGNKWPEYFFTGVPFHSVLPDVDRFPCYTQMGPDPDPVEDDGPRSPSMSHARFTADLDAIVDNTTRLVRGEVDYDTALTDHFRRLLALRGGDRTALWSVDDVHLDALP